MAHVRELHRGPHVYYELVESYRDEEGRGHTRVLKYLGKHKTPPPDPVTLSGLHFGTLAADLMEGTLTPTHVFDLLDRIGKKPMPLPQLEAIGIRFDFQKKLLTLYLYPKASSSNLPPRAHRAKEPGASSGRSHGRA